MRCRQIPARKRGSFVFVITEPDYIGHPFLKIGPVEPGLADRIVGKRAWGIENRVRAEYEKLFDATNRGLSGAWRLAHDVARELKNAVVALIAMALAQQNRASDILQRRINSVGQQLNTDRLWRPRQDQASTRFRNQIVYRFI